MTRRFVSLLACFVLTIVLSACTDPEREARAVFNEALLFEQKGEMDKAEELLRRISTEYPDTQVATEAIHELQKIRSPGAVITFRPPLGTDFNVAAAERMRGRVQLESIETALKLYKLDNGSYPTTEQGLQALVERPSVGTLAKDWRKGGYLDEGKVPKDPWGNDFVYLSPGVHGAFDLSSYGADGKPGGDSEEADINNWELE